MKQLQRGTAETATSSARLSHRKLPGRRADKLTDDRRSVAGADCLNNSEKPSLKTHLGWRKRTGSLFSCLVQRNRRQPEPCWGEESASIFKKLVNVSDLSSSSHLAGELAECLRNWDRKLLCEVRRERALHFKRFGFYFKREHEGCDQDQRWNL